MSNSKPEATFNKDFFIRYFKPTTDDREMIKQVVAIINIVVKDKESISFKEFRRRLEYYESTGVITKDI